MTTSGTVTIKQREAMTVAYLSRKGSYYQIREAMGALFGGLGGKGLAPAGPPGGSYYNSPAETPESELLWDLWVAVAGNPAEEPAAVGAGVGIRRVPSTHVAFAMHRGPHDPMDEVMKTYGALMRWIEENGYEITGPSEEVYLTDLATTPPEQLLTEIRFPVSKKG